MQITCPACKKTMNPPKEIACRALCEERGRKVVFYFCPGCRLTLAPGNTYDFTTERDFQQDNRPTENRGRIGTHEWPGREYAMACMAKEILERAGLACGSILIYGAGLSTDHLRLAESFPDIRVKISDLDNFQKAPNFIPFESNEKFDILVACEVIEHFLDLPKDFLSILSKVTPSGLAVMSTNVSDGKDIAELQYPFFAGHTAYYSGKALIAIAKSVDDRMRTDFRLPHAAVAQLGPRKRYVLMHQSDNISQGIADYFSDHPMAPSEDPVVPSVLERLVRFFRRISGRLSK